MTFRQSEEGKERGREREGRVDDDGGSQDSVKWDEGPSGEVEVNGNPHYRSFSEVQTDRPLKINQSVST